MKHKEYGMTTVFECFPKTYGIVNRKGKQHYRNYKRKLKNGRGLSGFDLMMINFNEKVSGLQVM